VIEIGSLIETKKPESGIYFVSVRDGEKQWVKKIMVE